MQPVIVLEDLPTQEGENKSLRLSRQIAATGLQAFLFDGRECVRVLGGEKEKPVVEKQFLDENAVGHTSVESFVQWVENRFGQENAICIIVDLKFGPDKDQYGWEVFRQLNQNQEFRPKLEPIVYSRWASDDKRKPIAKRFGVSGERVLQRDVDPEERVIKLVTEIFNTNLSAATP